MDKYKKRHFAAATLIDPTRPAHTQFAPFFHIAVIRNSR
jgi:hypothetical protein